jgi:LacI family transcriptional regulator
MTIYDIARKTGFSVATVSRTINGGPVKDSTKKLIEKTIEEMKYVPSANAKSAVAQLPGTIAVVVPDITNPFFAGIIDGITRELNTKQYNTLLFNTEYNLEIQYQVLERILKEKVKGVILCPLVENDERAISIIGKLEKSNIPVVFVDRAINGYDNYNGVFADDYHGSYRAVSWFVEHGHKRIGIIRGPQNSWPGRERFKGYAMALVDNGISVEEELIHDSTFLLDGTSYEATKEMMKMADPPTAIFSSSNQMTVECLKCLLDMGLKAGEDVALIGLDTVDALDYLNMNISVVERPIKQICVEAVKLLENSIETLEVPFEKKMNIFLDTKLILKGSEMCNKV